MWGPETGGGANSHPEDRFSGASGGAEADPSLDIGVSSPENPELSPGGRQLIGKIGIGLFSVSQLCREFHVITKRKGDRYRLVAEISLRRYNEEVPELADGEVEAGHVRIRSVKASDTRSHGTDVVLTRLSLPARDLLRSRDIWDRVAEGGQPGGDTFRPPTYHIGRVDSSGELLERTANLPWDPSDSPNERFLKLHDKVIGETGERNAKPRLETTLDRYLRTLWYLSLAAPLDYLHDTHPFDLTGRAFRKVYVLSNDQKGSVDDVKLGQDQSIRDKLDLHAPNRPEGGLAKFDVFVDNVRLRRPLAFDGGPTAKKADPARAPLLFIGRFDPNLTKIPAERSGGAHLSFEGYFLWTPRVVPTDHTGVMIRIADASGTLFDNTFLGYQVAELTRLSQISAELFVLKGLDSALNIDRESFNFGHPHAKIVASWVHRALRQVATAQKRIVKDARDNRRTTEHQKALARTDEIVEEQLETLGIDEPTEVAIVDGDVSRVRQLRREGTAAFERTAVLGSLAQPAKGPVQIKKRDEFQKKLEAVIKLLDAYGVLQRLTYVQQENLLKAVSEIFGAEE